MTKKLHALATWVGERDWPRVPCPDCENGSVGFEKAAKYKDQLSIELLDRVHRNLDGPDELSGTFTGTLRCDHSHCRRQLVMAGDWMYAIDFDDEEGRARFRDMYRVRYVNPALRVIRPPERTPATVKAAIDAASDVLWLNPNAAANQLRQAVEELLTARRVNKVEITAKGKRHRLTTHGRITAYRSRRADVADTLEAVKWIGNNGSHESSLSVKDVLDGAAFLDLALRLLYDRNDAKLLADAKAVNKRRGLPRKQAAR